MLRRLFALVAVAAFPLAIRADDTKEFLAPANWEGLPGLWKIDGTTITGKADPGLKSNTFFVSKATYTDFELSFQAKLANGVGNSGVQVRSKLLDPKKFVVGGPQADMGQQYWGIVYGEQLGKDGKIPGGGHIMKEGPKDFVKNHVKTKEFNDYKIVVKGKRIAITINGTTTVDSEFPIIPDEGIIALQLHAGPPMEVTYKNVLFKKLK